MSKVPVHYSYKVPYKEDELWTIRYSNTVKAEINEIWNEMSE